MNKPLINLILLHFREFFREPEILFWGIGFPILLAWILGIAFSKQGDTPLAVGLIAPQQLSQSFIRSLPLPNPTDPGSARFKWKTYSDEKQALLGIKRGDILLYLQLTAESQNYGYFLDPKNQEARLAYLLLEKQRTRQAFPAPAVHELKAPGSRYIDFLLPGLMALGIMNACLWGIGWSLIDHRIKKMLRRMVATPMKRYELLLSYFITRSLLSLFEICALLFFSMWYFQVQLQGSWLAFLLLWLCGNIMFGGLAILMASRAKNSQVGNGLINALTMPFMVLSGVFFSYKNFPDWVIPIIEKLPLTLLADGLRKVFIEGAGVLDVAIPALILTVLGSICFAIGLRIFKWY